MSYTIIITYHCVVWYFTNALERLGCLANVICTCVAWGQHDILHHTQCFEKVHVSPICQWGSFNLYVIYIHLNTYPVFLKKSKKGNIDVDEEEEQQSEKECITRGVVPTRHHASLYMIGSESVAWGPSVACYSKPAWSVGDACQGPRIGFFRIAQLQGLLAAS